MKGIRIDGHRPEPSSTGDRDLARQRALLTRDVGRRLSRVCAEIGMSEQQFRAVVRAIVDIKLGWMRRRLMS